MKRFSKPEFVKRWTPLAATGMGLSALGLTTGAVFTGRLLRPWLHGGGNPGSFAVLAMVFLASVSLTGAGFLLMVVGSDPFDDAAEEFEDESHRAA